MPQGDTLLGVTGRPPHPRADNASHIHHRKPRKEPMPETKIGGHAHRWVGRLRQWLMKSTGLIKALTALIQAVAALIRAWKGGGPA